MKEAIMLVKNWMSTPAVTVDENDAMDEAARIMKNRRIRFLPVTRDGKLTGVVTDRDLKRASASDATTLDVHELLYLISRIKVRQIMSASPRTVAPDTTLEETAELLTMSKISGAPVCTAAGVLVGVITLSDIARAFIAITGYGRRGIQYALQLEDRPGSAKAVTDIIRAHGARLLSVITRFDGVPEGWRTVYIRIYDLDRSRLEAMESEMKRVARMLYRVDHRFDKREIFETAQPTAAKAAV
jgi:acetoin utilization protein AcuB